MINQKKDKIISDFKTPKTAPEIRVKKPRAIILNSLSIIDPNILTMK
tara:strand:+ start:600 stop:740 length:141 start_codon:yes stop_codon:yes gene_type:complete